MNTLTKTVVLALHLAVPRLIPAQSVDWTAVIWREPQVRYLLTDMTLNGGKTDFYRKYAAEEKDPDSREGISADSMRRRSRLRRGRAKPFRAASMPCS